MTLSQLKNVQTDQLKLSLVTNYLKGSAFNALMRYRKNANPTWTGFEDLLRSQFEDSNLDYKIRTQFFHLKMTDSFPKYLTRFQELLNQMTDHSGDDTDILYKFTDGLTKEYALAVRRDKCETLNEAIKVCQDIDCLSRNFNDNGHIQESVNKVKRINFSKSKARLSQMPSKNFQRNNFNYSKSRYDGKPFKTFGLNNPKSKISRNGNIKSDNKIVDLSNIMCYKCKSKGHYSNRCQKYPNRNSNSNKSKKVYSINVYTEIEIDINLLNIKGLLNVIPIIMTLDSGATTCVLSERIARKHNFKILKSNVMVKVAHNEIIKVVGVTESLLVNVKGHTCKLKMYVLPNSEFECLLGLNWFVKMNVSISPSERTIRFQSETFSIDDNEPLIENDLHESVMMTDIVSYDAEIIHIPTEWDSSPFKGIKP